jgi:hypothetical protein
MAGEVHNDLQSGMKNTLPTATAEQPPAVRRKISKERLPVVLRVLNYRIEGTMHVVHHMRVLDILNNPEPFLPITDARVYNGSTGALVAETEFIAINKKQIVVLREDQPGSVRRPGEEDASDEEAAPGPLDVFEEDGNDEPLHVGDETGHG